MCETDLVQIEMVVSRELLGEKKEKKIYYSFCVVLTRAARF